LRSETISLSSQSMRWPNFSVETECNLGVVESKPLYERAPDHELAMQMHGRPSNPHERLALTHVIGEDPLLDEIELAGDTSSA
jgi:hypothetical protein